MEGCFILTQSAVSSFDDSIKELEMKAGQALQATLSSLQNHPKQYFLEFQKYKGLLSRKVIWSYIGPETEVLVGNLTRMIESIRTLCDDADDLSTVSNVLTTGERASIFAQCFKNQPN